MHLEFKFDTRAIQNKFKKLTETVEGRDITRKIGQEMVVRPMCRIGLLMKPLLTA